MEELREPLPIGVEVPEHSVFYPNRNMFTMFFRPATYLPELLSLAVDRASDPENVKIMSAACSIGAEADSILALHRAASYTGRIVMRGYDVNPLVVKAATTGVYRLGDYKPGAEYKMHKKKRQLEEYCFDTFTTHRRDFDGALVRELQVRSETLRASHDVEFREHDIREPFEEVGFDLVLANNVLYHLPAEGASQVIYNLASTLADRGILSISGGYTRLSRDWIGNTSEILRSEFGLKPVLTAAFSTPVAFAKA
jgi:chemotaxis methyl-accepting protein methylase